VYAAVRDRRWRELGADALRMAGIDGGLLWDWSAQIISNQEGERHTRLRRLVSQAFTPRSADRLRPFMRTSANALLDAIGGAAECEFVEAFAAPYPVASSASCSACPRATSSASAPGPPTCRWRSRRASPRSARASSARWPGCSTGPIG
jgi:cytochrome P450